MSDDQPRGDQHPEPDRTPQYYRPTGAASGCWTAFVVLWGIALLMVGILITAVSGFCGFVVLQDGGTGVRDFGGMLAAGLVFGLALCFGGYLILRSPNR